MLKRIQTNKLTLFLAPMEGLINQPMRDALTLIGGLDQCTTEFVRVSGSKLPRKVFLRYCPEMDNDFKTAGNTPIIIQLLGSDLELMAQNAAYAIELGSPGLDLNFGCPAKTVNRHRGGSVLLQYPDEVHKIVSSVRKQVPPNLPLSVKIRLGYEDKSLAIENAQAIEKAGADFLIVHARTKIEAYRPPAHWQWIRKIKDATQIPIVANGDIWSLEDYKKCKEETTCTAFMLGRGVVSRPDLAKQIKSYENQTEDIPMSWEDFLPVLKEFIKQSSKHNPLHALTRTKQWSKLLSRNYQEASDLFETIKRSNDPACLTKLFD